jgi:citrate lyase beta subunit
MYRDFDHIELGATLYTPATNKNLIDLASGKKFSYLTSIVFCLEDAIKDDEIDDAMLNLQNFLEQFKVSHIKIFIRPHDANNLNDILNLKYIEKIDGFSLAKFSYENSMSYFDILNQSNHKFHIMPVIESQSMFDTQKLINIRNILLSQKIHNINTLRIGGEDMFKMIGIKKDCEQSIHDFHISSKVFGELLSIFKPYGFNLCAPVYNCLENISFLKKEILRDLKEGFFGKTCIHPIQVKTCNELYKVTQNEIDEAKSILNNLNDAIFRFENKMCEPKAHSLWANQIIKRSKIYGIKTYEI